MSKWTNEELAAIAGDQDLYIAIPNADGEMHAPTRIWAVQAGDQLYARSYNGVEGRWYTAAKAAGHGRITSGGVEKDVTFEFPADSETNSAVDEGYRQKYAGSPYTPPMLEPPVQAATVRLVPINSQENA